MNKFFSIVFIISLILMSSCKSKSKSPEEKKCMEMLEYMYELTINSAQITNLSPSEQDEAIDSLRGELEAKKTSSIKSCVKEFKNSTYKCIMNSNDITDLSKCD